MDPKWTDRILAMLARACAFGAAGGAAAGAKPLTVLFLGACAAGFYEWTGVTAKRYVPPAASLDDSEVLK